MTGLIGYAEPVEADIAGHRLTYCLGLSLGRRFVWLGTHIPRMLRQNPEMAARMMTGLLAIMRNEEPPMRKTPLIEVHDTVWERVVKVCTCDSPSLF